MLALIPWAIATWPFRHLAGGKPARNLALAAEPTDRSTLAAASDIRVAGANIGCSEGDFESSLVASPRHQRGQSELATRWRSGLHTVVARLAQVIRVDAA